jgi:ABC-type polysaccharide/polyol phosphate export permease
MRDVSPDAAADLLRRPPLLQLRADVPVGAVLRRASGDSAWLAGGWAAPRPFNYVGDVPRAAVQWTVNSSRGVRLVEWRELWEARELVGFFALRDLQVRYKQAVIGVAWVVLQPLVTVLAFTLAFQAIAKVNTLGIPYPVFALSGLLSWQYIAQCVSRGSEVLVANPALINKVYFPRLVAPIAATLPSLVDLGVGLGVLAVVCVVFSVGPSLALLLLPSWLLLLWVTALGPVLLLASLNVRYRDVRYLVSPVLQVLLFLSPVAYSSEGLRGSGELWYALNPAVGPLELGRFVLIGGPWPGWPLAVSVASALLIAVVGLVHFQLAQRFFADYI